MSTCGTANLKNSCVVDGPVPKNAVQDDGPAPKNAAQEIDTSRAVAPPQVVDEWLCGYAAALAAVQRLYGESTLVKEVMKCDGILVEHFRAAGVESFDLIQIVKAVGK